MKKEYINEFLDYQQMNGAYGNIDLELNRYVYDALDMKGPKAKLLIKQMKAYMIKKKLWNVKKEDWNTY